MQIRPLGPRALVRLKVYDETEGGILLPDQSEQKEKPQRGVVVRVGPGVFRMFDRQGYSPDFWPMDVKEGDEILFAHYAGKDTGDLSVFAKQMKDHLLIDMKDIFCVLEPNEPAKPKK